MAHPKDVLECIEYVNKKQNHTRFNTKIKDAVKLIDYNINWASTLDGHRYWMEAVNGEYEDSDVYDLVRNSKEYAEWQEKTIPAVEFNSDIIQAVKQFAENN